MSTEATNTVAGDASNQKAAAPIQSLVTAPVVEQTTGAKVKKPKAVKADKPTASATKVATLKVDFKRATEDLKNKVPLPGDMSFIVNENRNFLVQPALIAAIASVIGNNDLKEPIAIDRKVVLNRFCIAQTITPLMCKKMNKTENATISTYGVVPTFTDTFDSGSTTNYRLFGFLKHPIIVAEKWAAVKYNTYLLVMSIESYRQLLAGELLVDKQLTLVG